MTAIKRWAPATRAGRRTTSRVLAFAALLILGLLVVCHLASAEAPPQIQPVWSPGTISTSGPQRLTWVSQAIVEAEVVVDTAEAREELCFMGYACPSRGVCRLQLEEEQVMALEESGFVVAVKERGIRLTARPEPAGPAQGSAALAEFNVGGSNASTVPIPDGPDGNGVCGAPAYSTVNITTAPSWATVSKVSYYAAIAHTHYSDLIVRLRCGLISSATIWDRNGTASPISGVFLTEFDGLPVNTLWGLVALDCWGADTGSITYFAITVYYECDLPATPSGPSPGHGATNVPLDSNLDWADSAGATGYDVYFGTSPLPPKVASPTSSGYYVPYYLSPSTHYYWYVAALNACGSVTGGTWNFTTCALPGTPSGPSPADHATGISRDTDLDWADASGATSYDVYFGWLTEPLSKVGSSASSSFHFQTVLCGDAAYHWRIVTKNECGDTEGPEWVFSTEICTLSIPSGPSPADHATNVSVNADLDWADVPNAEYYWVRFGTSAFPIVDFYADTAVSSVALPTLDYNTHYFWQVGAWHCCALWNGPVWDFTTEQQGCTVPGVPGTPSPANSASSVSLDADLDWADASGATSYDVYFGTAASPPLYGTTGSSSYALPALTCGTQYFWKIVAKNSCGETPGPIWSFTTICCMPATPSGPSPANGATNVPLAGDLQWAGSAGDSSYDIYFGTSTPPPYRYSTAGTVGNASGAGLLPYTHYYWKIVAHNPCGETAGPVWEFTTCGDLPAEASSPSPANNATGVSINGNLDWADVTGATGYRVELGTNPQQNVWEIVDEFTTSSSYSLPTLDYDTHYYWRVWSINWCWRSLSPTWDFTTMHGPTTTPTLTATPIQEPTGTTANTPTRTPTATPTVTSRATPTGTPTCPVPGTPSDPSPGNGATNQSVNADLDWADASGATSYDVYFGTSASPPYYGSAVISSFGLPALDYNTHYYWKIVARNSCGDSDGPLWDFTTQPEGCTLPGTLAAPSPADHATGVSVSVDLDWADASAATSYDIYFGTSASPPYYGSAVISSYGLPALNYNTPYYWKIIARNSCGDTAGPLWQFRTAPTWSIHLPIILRRR